MGEALDILIDDLDEVENEEDYKNAMLKYGESEEAKAYLEKTNNMCDGSCRDSPVCDNCAWYCFSLDWCGYPDHPRESYPHEGCYDYECQFYPVEGYVSPPWWRKYKLDAINFYLGIKYKITGKY